MYEQFPEDVPANTPRVFSDIVRRSGGEVFLGVDPKDLAVPQPAAQAVPQYAARAVIPRTVTRSRTVGREVAGRTKPVSVVCGAKNSFAKGTNQAASHLKRHNGRSVG